MSVTEAAGKSTDRTWRLPVATRIASALCLGVLTSLPGLFLALMLVTNQVPDGGWIALALAVSAWGLLAWRALAQSVTLTPDRLVIRNILATEQVLLADVTKVGFRRGLLTVTTANGAAAGEQLAASAVSLGSSRWSGRRSRADDIAEAIADAAGLSPPPPRKEVIGRGLAWIILLPAAVCVAVGVYYGPLWRENWNVPLAWREASVVLYVGGAGMLGLALRTIRDHQRRRDRQADSDD